MLPELFFLSLTRYFWYDFNIPTRNSKKRFLSPFTFGLKK